MSKPDEAINLTLAYEGAAAGRLRATIPALPGTISWGPTQAEARSNIVDALRTMLSVEPEQIPDGARGRGRARHPGHRTAPDPRSRTRPLAPRTRTDSLRSWQHPRLI